MINPMSGVNRTERKNVQPKPILLLAPTKPTNAARNESVNNPNINRVNPIVLKSGENHHTNLWACCCGTHPIRAAQRMMSIAFFTLI